MLKLLLSAGADVNATKKDGCTALQLAVMRHQHDTVCLGRKSHIKRGLINLQGNSAVHCACNAGCRQSLEMLFLVTKNRRKQQEQSAKGSEYDAISLNSSIHDKIREMLLHKNRNGLAPLHLACHHGHAELVKVILNSGLTPADSQCLVNMRTPNGWAPLHTAVERGFLPVVKILLQEGLQTLQSLVCKMENPVCTLLAHQYKRASQYFEGNYKGCSHQIKVSRSCDC